jgi:hypothetical protein
MLTIASQNFMSAAISLRACRVTTRTANLHHLRTRAGDFEKAARTTARSRAPFRREHARVPQYP